MANSLRCFIGKTKSKEVRQKLCRMSHYCDILANVQVWRRRGDAAGGRSNCCGLGGAIRFDCKGAKRTFWEDTPTVYLGCGDDIYTQWVFAFSKHTQLHPSLHCLWLCGWSKKNEHDEKIMHRIHFFIPKWAYPSFCCFIDLSIYLKVWSTETEEEKKRRGRERMREREQESSICWFTTQITTSTKSWARQIQELGDSPTFAHRCRHSRHIFCCIAQAISSYLDWQTAVGTWTHIRGCMSGNSITCQIPMLDSHLPFGFSTDMSSPPT